MAFRASNQVPGDGYQRAKRIANSVAAQATNWANVFASGGNSNQIFQMVDQFRARRDELLAIRDIPNIGLYAQEQESDVTYDVAQEFNALVSAINAVITEVSTTFPASGGFLLSHSIDGNGVLSPRQFNAAALSGLRTNLTALAGEVV